MWLLHPTFTVLKATPALRPLLADRCVWCRCGCCAEDMLRDLEKEFSEYSKEKQSKAGGSGSSEGGRMKSLWEELADIGKDIGEELVEFLEQVRRRVGMGAGVQLCVSAMLCKCMESSCVLPTAGLLAHGLGSI